MHKILGFDVSLPKSLHGWCLPTNHEIQKHDSYVKNVIEPYSIKEITAYFMYERIKKLLEKTCVTFLFIEISDFRCNFTDLQCAQFLLSSI